MAHGVWLAVAPITMSLCRFALLFTAALAIAVRPASAQVIVTLQNATAGFSQGGFPVSQMIDGDTTGGGWAHDGAHFDDAAVYETATDLNLPTLTFTMTMVFGNHQIGRFRISTTTDDRSTFADGLQNGGDLTANWTVLALTNLVSSGGATLTLLSDGSVLASGPFPNTDVYTFSATTSNPAITGFRLEVLTDPSLPLNGPGAPTLNGNFVLTEFSITAIPEPATDALFAAGLVGFGVVALRRRCALTRPAARRGR